MIGEAEFRFGPNEPDFICYTNRESQLVPPEMTAAFGEGPGFRGHAWTEVTVETEDKQPFRVLVDTSFIGLKDAIAGSDRKLGLRSTVTMAAEPVIADGRHRLRDLRQHGRQFGMGRLFRLSQADGDGGRDPGRQFARRTAHLDRCQSAAGRRHGDRIGRGDLIVIIAANKKGSEE